MLTNFHGLVSALHIVSIHNKFSGKGAGIEALRALKKVPETVVIHLKF